MAEFGLRRVLGLKELVAIEVGTTVGAGVFVLTGMALEMGGPLLPLAYLVAAVPVVLVMLSLAMLGSALPTVGGTYRYPSRLFSPMWAFMGVWIYAMGTVFGAFPLYALRAAEYLTGIVPFFQSLDPPVLDSWIRGLAVLWLTVFFAANLCGISIAAAVQGAMVVMLVSALLYYGIDGLTVANLENMHPLLPNGLGGFFAASALLTFSLLGANSVIELGGEIRNPGRNIPRSLLISIPLVAALYVLVGFVAAAARPWRESAGQLLTVPAEAFLGPFEVKVFVIAGALLAITTTLNATFMWATKSVMILAHDGFLPAALLGTNRFGAPHRFLAALWILAVVSVLARAPAGTFEVFAGLGGLVIFIPVMCSALLLRRRMPERYKASPFKLRGPLYWICPIAGILLSLACMIMLLGQLRLLPVLFLVFWSIAGAAYYLLRRRALERARGMSLGRWMRQEARLMSGIDRE